MMHHVSEGGVLWAPNDEKNEICWHEAAASSQEVT